MDMTGILLLAAVYFLPAIVGFARGHASAGGILVVNLFLGWTFLGWVLSFAWSCSNTWRQPAGISYLSSERPPRYDAKRVFEHRIGRVIAWIVGACVLLIVAGLALR
ncbi:MAG: superinfection immunity protein [Rhizobiales bacterium]|nr:superinfection immunity protein [Hyphomicrobiales bacterium]